MKNILQKNLKMILLLLSKNHFERMSGVLNVWLRYEIIIR